jgi:mannose-6-phosphate isomerase
MRRLVPRPVERPWGGSGLPAYGLGAPPGVPIGEWWVSEDDFPLLVKVLDARENLSVQLHPDDAEARRCGLASGKAEAWFVLAAAADARILLGLRPEVPAETFFDAAAADEDVSKMLAEIIPAPGDLIYVPPGTLHAVLAGCTLLEVQQRSDVTYRVFDWRRRPTRPLHLAEARAAFRLDPRAGRVAGNRLECPYFSVEGELVHAGDGVTRAGGAAAEIVFAISGRAWVRAAGVEIVLEPGAFVLCAAGDATMEISADGAMSFVMARIRPAPGHGLLRDGS